MRLESLHYQQDFNVDGNYPGHRTQSFLTPSVKEEIGHIVRGDHGEIICLIERIVIVVHINTQLQADRTWIHADGWNDWAGVCLLTPDAPQLQVLVFIDINQTGITRIPRLPDGSRNGKPLMSN